MKIRVIKMKEAYYFSHDSNASQDPKILQMCSVYKAEGYGWYWMLIEMMRDQENYKLSLKGKYAYHALAMRMYCERNAIEQFINDCIYEFGLFISDGDFVWSESLINRMKIKDDKAEKARKSAQIRWGNYKNDANEEQSQCDGNANASENDALKESKLKEIFIVFNFWNSKKIVTHKTLTDKIRRHINARLDDGYSTEEICNAIENYNTVLNGDEYFWSYKWRLDEFLIRGLDKFKDDSTPLKNFLNKDQQNKHEKTETYSFNWNEMSDEERQKWIG